MLYLLVYTSVPPAGGENPPRVEMHLIHLLPTYLAEWSRDERFVVECAKGEPTGNLRVKDYGTSLAVQWLRLRLPVQGV